MHHPAKRHALLFAALLATSFLLVAPGCGGDGGDGDNSDAGTGDGGINPNRVSGRFSLTSITDTTVRKLPVDLVGVPIEAIMGDGERIAGEGELGGSFEILGVPEGSYTLRIGNRYFATDIRRFELAIAVLGRDDAEPLETHTPLSLSLTELSPWSDGDTFELFSPGGGFAYIDALGPLSADPTVGSTSYTGQIDGVLAQSAGEADSDEGDVMYVTQVGSRPSGESEIREVLRGVAIESGVDIRSGSGSTIAGELAAVPVDRILNIDWDAPAYDAAMTQIGPSAPSDVTMNVRLVITPTDPTYGAITAFPTLAAATISGTDVVSLTANFGSPFPSHWNELEIDELSATVELGPTEGTVTLRAGAATYPGRLAAGASPLISPPDAPTISGQPALEALTAVGETPVIAWDAPTLGGANAYEIDVVELSPNAGVVASLYTGDTSITLPAGVLETGGVYFVVLRSRSTPSLDLAENPLAKTVPSAFAELASAPFSP